MDYYTKPEAKRAIDYRKSPNSAGLKCEASGLIAKVHLELLLYFWSDNHSF